MEAFTNHDLAVTSYLHKPLAEAGPVCWIACGVRPGAREHGDCVQPSSVDRDRSSTPCGRPEVPPSVI